MTKHIAILSAALASLGGPVAAAAHDLVSLNGRAMDHQHVQQRGQYGEPLRQGHYAKPYGSNGIVIWEPTGRSAYGQMTPTQGVGHPFRPHHHRPISPLQRQFNEEAAKDSFGHSWKSGDDNR